MEKPYQPPTRSFTVSLAFVALITPLAVHLFFPVIPAVKIALGLTDAFAQLTFSISLFGMAFATLFYGSLSDRYGRRPVLISGLVLFMVGSVLSALAPTATTLVLGRLIQAIGAGCAQTLVRAIARDAYRAEQLIKAIAYFTMFGTVGPMIAPAVGGLLIDTLGWRSVFGFAIVAGGVISINAYWTLHETLPAANRMAGGTDSGVLRSYTALFSRLRFNAFVFQTGLNTAAFMVMATSAASLMATMLHRPATEFGLYFLLFPIGFFIGNFISTRVGNRASTEFMVLAGSVMTIVSVVGQALFFAYGWATPLAFFIPGTFVTMAQGIALPYGQVGAMKEVPRFAGTAAGIGVFMQNFCAAISTQVYGFIADGTPWPMVLMAVSCGLLTLVSGTIPMLMKCSGRVAPA